MLPWKRIIGPEGPIIERGTVNSVWIGYDPYTKNYYVKSDIYPI